MKRAPVLVVLLSALGLGASVTLSACSENADKHLQRAQDGVFEKKPQVALREYRQALDILESSDSPEAQVQRARALKGAADVYYLELRDTRAAVPVYRELIRRYPESREALEARPTLADVLRIHFRDLRGAIAELAAAVERNHPKRAELRYQVAKLYFELGDYQQCQLEAAELAKQDETSAFVDDALFLRSQALAMVEGGRPEAIKAFEDLVQRFSDSELTAYALFELGKLRAEGNEHDRAIELWVRALKKHPDPKLVQASISRVRRTITNTTPAMLGDREAIFDRTAQVQPRTKPVIHKTSIEAVGGSAEEARRDHGDGASAAGRGLIPPSIEAEPPAASSDVSK